MILWNFRCEDCEYGEERLIRKGEEESQMCPQCETPMKKVIAPNPGWLISKERTYEMLKKRSHDHSARCKAKDISMKDNDTQETSDPVWRNKNRAKNTSRETINQFRNVHKTWTDQPRIQKL